MSAVLKIVDERYAGPQPGRRPALELRLVSERTTPREIIHRRVTAEVETINVRRAEHLAGHDRARSWLVDPAEELLSPKPRLVRRTLDTAKEIKRAEEGFLRGSFIMLFDDQQVEDLDQAVTVGPQSEAVFLYMIPLKGG